MLVLFGNLADAYAQPMHDATRAELLRSTQCIACRSAEVHWRDQKPITDRTSPQAEVRRGHGLSWLGWGDDGVAEMA